MQRLFELSVSLGLYLKSTPHEVVARPERCPGCQNLTLHRHGYYERNVVLWKQELRLKVARFLCPRCWRTLSLLPNIVLPYAVLALEMVVRFFSGAGPPSCGWRHEDLLKCYWRRWCRRWPELWAVAGGWFGRMGPATDPKKGWEQAGARGGGHAQTHQDLIRELGESLLGQYRIHARAGWSA